MGCDGTGGDSENRQIVIHTSLLLGSIDLSRATRCQAFVPEINSVVRAVPGTCMTLATDHSVGIILYIRPPLIAILHRNTKYIPARLRVIIE